MKEAFLCYGIRSPFGKYGGVLSSMRPDDMAAKVIGHVLEKTNITDAAKADIDELILGNANQAGEDNRNVARMSLLLAGLPPSVPGITVNRLCASGLEAVAMAARMIKVGEADLVLAGGVESMSRAPLVMPKAESAFSRKAEIYDSTIGWRFVNKTMQKMYGTDSMPETAENVASQFGISRADQDKFAWRSQKRYARALAAGYFDEEIMPISLSRKKLEPLSIDKDEGPRPDSSLEKLATLPTPFREQHGSVTAGNASGVNDGACVMLLASAAALKKHKLRPMARIIAAAALGIEPRIMGMGPVGAVHKVLRREKLQLSNIAAIELNEAFAAQSLGVLRALGLADDSSKVNPNGGAIAIGHPLGASGARLVLTLARHLQITSKGSTAYGLATMCVGVGQGSALLLEKI